MGCIAGEGGLGEEEVGEGGKAMTGADNGSRFSRCRMRAAYESAKIGVISQAGGGRAACACWAIESVQPSDRKNELAVGLGAT